LLLTVIVAAHQKKAVISKDDGFNYFGGAEGRINKMRLI
jgi:hypothetical protein